MAKRGRPGGVRQQVAAYEAEHGTSNSSSAEAKSALATLLLYEVLWGFLTVAAARRVAEAAIPDGLNHPDLQKIQPTGYERELGGERLA